MSVNDPNGYMAPIFLAGGEVGDRVIDKLGSDPQFTV